MTKLDGKTPDLAAENIEQLRQIFPDVFEEGKIDFDKLKQVLGECGRRKGALQLHLERQGQGPAAGADPHHRNPAALRGGEQKLG